MEATETLFSNGRVRVAVADDDPLARKAIETMLSSDDSLELVGGVGSVETIVELVGREHPAVVVLDWMMPHGGGPEAAHRIAQLSPETRIVGLSSSDRPEAYVDMLRAGASCFLVKGGTSGELVEAVYQATDPTGDSRR